MTCGTARFTTCNGVMGLVSMTDKEQAVQEMRAFLQNDSKKSLLLCGVDDSAKIKAAIICLSASFKKGIVRTSDMRVAPVLLNTAFNRQIVPLSIVSTANYELGGGLTAYISRYDGQRTKRNPVGNQNTFTLFLLEASVLDDAKRYASLVDELDACKSQKIVVLTTNERGVKNWAIKKKMDAVVTYGAR